MPAERIREQEKPGSPGFSGATRDLQLRAKKTVWCAKSKSRDRFGVQFSYIVQNRL